MVETATNGFLHGLPYRLEIVPDFLVLTFLHIFPERAAVIVAPALYIAHLVEVVHFGSSQFIMTVNAIRKGSTANAVNRPLVYNITIHVPANKLHSVGVKGQEHLWLPDNADSVMWMKHLLYGDIRHVSLASGCQTAIQSHLIRRCVATAFQKELGSTLGSHRMTARRSLAYSIKLA